jgi:hypothetical protein
MERPSETRMVGPLIGIVGGLLVALATSYVVGYFHLCPRKVQTEDELYRCYRYRWAATIYQPAAYVESFVTGKEVQCRVLNTTVIRTVILP